MNQTKREGSQLGDLRIRKNNNGLPKELVPRKVPILNKKQKMIRTIVKFNNLEKDWKEKTSNEARESRLWDKEVKEMTNVIEGEKEKGFKKRNNPKFLRKVYNGREEKENLSKQELRSNTAVKFISSNVNMGK
jgi:hypothetical protein